MADQHVAHAEEPDASQGVWNNSSKSETAIKLNNSAVPFFLMFPGMFNSTVDAFVTVYAFSIFITNAMILAILIRMLMSLRGRKEADVVVNMFFVCLNDTLCGLVLILYSAIKIDGIASGQLCAYVGILCLTLLTMSQGNILCICFQRFMAARNLRTVKKGTEIYRSISLLLVNVFVAATSFMISISQATIKSPNVGTRIICSFYIVLRESAGTIGKTFYYFQLVTTILADILCTVTIVKLRQELNIVVNTGNSKNKLRTGIGSTASQQTTNIRLAVRTRQQKAILTLFLLLLFLNVSLLPHLLLYTLPYFGLEFTLIQPRFIFLVLYINSLVNPIIIMTRTQDIRLAVKPFFCNIKNKISSCTVVVVTAVNIKKNNRQ